MIMTTPSKLMYTTDFAGGTILAKYFLNSEGVPFEFSAGSPMEALEKAEVLQRGMAFFCDPRFTPHVELYQLDPLEGWKQFGTIELYAVEDWVRPTR